MVVEAVAIKKEVVVEVEGNIKVVVGAVVIKKGVVVEVEGEVNVVIGAVVIKKRLEEAEGEARILEEVVVVLEEKLKIFKIWEISTSLKVLIFLR